MTVGELREFLSSIPEEYEVVMSSDGEGNSYSPAWNAFVCQYKEDTTWGGEVLIEEDYEDVTDDDTYYDPEEDMGEYTPNAVCLSPTN